MRTAKRKAACRLIGTTVFHVSWHEEVNSNLYENGEGGEEGDILGSEQQIVRPWINWNCCFSCYLTKRNQFEIGLQNGMKFARYNTTEICPEWR